MALSTEFQALGMEGGLFLVADDAVIVVRRLYRIFRKYFRHLRYFRHLGYFRNLCYFGNQLGWREVCLLSQTMLLSSLDDHFAIVIAAVLVPSYASNRFCRSFLRSTSCHHLTDCVSAMVSTDIVNNDSLIPVSTTSSLKITVSFGNAFVTEATTDLDFDSTALITDLT